MFVAEYVTHLKTQQPCLVRGAVRAGAEAESRRSAGVRLRRCATGASASGANPPGAPAYARRPPRRPVDPQTPPRPDRTAREAGAASVLTDYVPPGDAAGPRPGRAPRRPLSRHVRLDGVGRRRPRRPERGLAARPRRRRILDGGEGAREPPRRPDVPHRRVPLRRPVPPLPDGPRVRALHGGPGAEDARVAPVLHPARAARVRDARGRHPHPRAAPADAPALRHRGGRAAGRLRRRARRARRRGPHAPRRRSTS